MWLTLDVGNTAIKGALFGPDTLEHVFRLDLDRTEMADEAAWTAALRAALEQAGPDAGLPTVRRAGAVSVVPAANAPLATAVHTLLELGLEQMGPASSLPFTLAYETPETLGADRLAAAAAAWKHHGRGARRTDAPDASARSVIAVDAGTAVTYEVVSRGGVYEGGAIDAGPALVRQALQDGTAQLPSVPLSVPDDVVGRSTETALQSGIMAGFVDSAQGMLGRLATALPDAPVVVLTGGWSELLHAHLRPDPAPAEAAGDDAPSNIHAITRDPHLVLQGVRVLMASRA
jgi:type III pantothenate kinase